jgi:hypothetical protein
MCAIILVGVLGYLYVRRKRQKRAKNALKSFSEVELMKNDIKLKSDLKFEELKIPKN